MRTTEARRELVPDPPVRAAQRRAGARRTAEPSSWRPQSRLIRSRRIGSLALLEFLYYLLAPWLVVPLSLAMAGMLVANVVGAVTGDSLGGWVTVGAALLAWSTALLAPGLIWGLVHRRRCGDEPLVRTLAVGATYPVLLLLGIVATWRAMFRQLSGRHGWAKTERLVEAATSSSRPALPGRRTVGRKRTQPAE